MKRIQTIGMIISLLFLVGCAPSQESPSQNQVSDKKMVVVGIAPMKEWVETIAKDSIDVMVMIPPGYSPANYEPTTKQILALEEMERYFAIGVGAETNGFLDRVFDESDPSVIHLYRDVNEILPDRQMEAHSHGDEADHEDESHDRDPEGDFEAEGRDPHIWLSIPRTIVMVERITDELVEINPDEEDAYRERSQAYVQELEMLEAELKAGFDKSSKNSFLLFHPSLGYFADDYGLNMMVIEEGGKSATPTHLIEMIDAAKDAGIHTVFYQEEFDKSQAETIAEELDGGVKPLAVLNENYLESIREIGESLIASME